ncbi:MAG: hypothetical protein V4850_06445 [Myxococcota bacterium]
MADKEDEVDPIGGDIPPSVSISKERADGQDSRATARLGEEPNGPSTRVTQGRGIAAKIAEHEAIIQHKELPEEAAIQFEKRGKRHRHE